MGLHIVRADRVLARLQRHDPRLDVEVAAELLPHDMHIAAEHQIRARGGGSGGLAAFAPVPLEGQTTEHDRLGRSLGSGAGGLAGRVEQIREHPDAALLDLGGAGILGVVDEVAVQVRGDDLLRLRLHPGRHESGQVPSRITLQRQVFRYQPQGVLGRHPRHWELPARNLLGDESVTEQRHVGIRRLGTVGHHVSFHSDQNRLRTHRSPLAHVSDGNHRHRTSQRSHHGHANAPARTRSSRESGDITTVLVKPSNPAAGS